MHRDAVITDCKLYRYMLEREWAEGMETCVFVMLNPSTADAMQDDNTIRRCISYAQDWDFTRLQVVNIYGFRATKPADLWKAKDPMGEHNMLWIHEVCKDAGRIVLAWGDHGVKHGAGAEMEAMLVETYADCVVVLGRNKSGEPVHPLYQRKDVKPKPAGRVPANA